MKIKQIDEMDGIIADKFSRFLMQRADNFVVLRRKALPVRPPAARPLASPLLAPSPAGPAGPRPRDTQRAPRTLACSRT